MSGARHVVVVPHTHWDREWYRTHEEFRYRLVRLLDGVLNLLERDPEFRHFTLDGQTVVVGDYLEVRPEERPRLEKRVRDGRLLVGPWFVLPDEWLVSGEALVRNLRLGRAQAEALGGAMPVGYVPDQFGHVGQLPQIFAGFGFEGGALWRGVGADVDRTTFWWEAPDGTRLFTVYLPFGYGNGVHLPEEPGALAERLGFELSRLESLSDIPSLLLMNGSDHVPPRPELPRMLQAAARELPGRVFEIGTLPGFLRRARAEAREPLPVHRGELRSGLRAPLLPGCASARMPLKQADFRNDRLLTRVLEPIAAWVGLRGGDPDPGVIDHAWRIALENHPHDSICGCSVDRVHDQMETRFRRVEEVARCHLERLCGELARHTVLPAGDGDALVVWNPNAGGVGGIEADVEVDGAGARHLRDASGRRIPVALERRRREQVLARMTLPARVAAWMLPALGGEMGGLHAREVRWRRRGARLDLEVRLGGQAGGLDLDATVKGLRQALEGAEEVRFLARRPAEFRLRFADDLPGRGLRAYRLCRGRAGASPLEAARDGEGGAAIANEHWRVEVRPDGRVALVERASGTRIEDALRLVSEGDRGDEYNFDPVPGGEVVERPERVRLRRVEADEAEARIVLEARYRVPAGVARDRARRTRRRVALPVQLELRLAAGLDRVDLGVELDHDARDERLRVHVRAPFRASRFEVESAFEVASRPIAPPLDAFGSERPSEFPIGAVPQRSFASVDDGRRALTVANRGLAEVEAVPEPEGTTSLAVTLLRAVGWLSRDDLRLRPGHAGPPLETPGAQVPGRQRFELSLRLHEAGAADRLVEAHRFAYPAFAFVATSSDAGSGQGDEVLVDVDDPAVVVTAIEPRAEGQLLVRGFNASDAPRRLRLRLPAAGGRGVEAVDLAERPRPGGVARAEEGVSLPLRPWEIFCLRTRDFPGGQA
jgi:alpha-mannosidase